MQLFKLFPFLVLMMVAGVPAAIGATFTDAAGRVVTVPDKIERVMTAGPPASVLLYVLAPEKMVGWVRKPDETAKDYILPSVYALPTYGQLTGRGGTANMEAVLAARPDIIIDVGTVNPTYASLADRVQQQTGIPYVLIDGTFANSANTLREAGTLLGVSDRANKLADYADKSLSNLRTKLAAALKRSRPRVYYGRGPEGLETGLSGSINMEIIEAVGATNVAATAGKGGLTQISAEEILSWKPDVILAASPKFARAAKLDPIWSGLEAVKNGNIHVTPSQPFGWIDSPPGINRLIGITWLESTLYPQSFNGDLKSEVRDFFKLFYQVDLDDAQIVKLLSGER